MTLAVTARMDCRAREVLWASRELRERRELRARLGCPAWWGREETRETTGGWEPRV